MRREKGGTVKGDQTLDADSNEGRKSDDKHGTIIMGQAK